MRNSAFWMYHWKWGCNIFFILIKKQDVQNQISVQISEKKFNRAVTSFVYIRRVKCVNQKHLRRSRNSKELVKSIIKKDTFSYSSFDNSHLKFGKMSSAWCSGYLYWTTSLNVAWIQVLRRFKSCSRRVGDSGWWGSLTMVLAEDKAKRLSSVNHTTKTIHHHHHHYHHHQNFEKLHFGWP